MNRFFVIVLVFFSVTVSVALPAHAQQAEKIYRIGYLDPGSASSNAVRLAAFRQELGKLGWIEGKHFTIEYLERAGARESGDQVKLFWILD